MSGSDDDFTDTACSDSGFDTDEEFEFSPPFWFSHEEPSHLQSICQLYSIFLKIGLEFNCKKRTDQRCLPNFIGQIHRTALKRDTSCTFFTLDTVDVHRRDVRLVGSPLTHLNQIQLLTSWDVQEGLPIRHQLLNQCDVFHWRCRSSDSISVIHCFPGKKIKN